MFGIVYPENITGDGGLLYVAILFISGLTILISTFLILGLKKFLNKAALEIVYGLIPFFVSFIIFHGFPDSGENFRNTFFISNSILLIGLYLLSILYKLNKTGI
jgi:hypothetical protein